MRQDAIMEGFWIFQHSEYVRFLHMQALHNILNIPEYGWIIPYGRVLNINMPELRIWQRICDGYTGCWISLGKTEYALIMSQNASICLNNTEYDWIYLHIPELTECSICQNSEYVWCSTRDKVTVQVTEQLWRQRYIQNTAKDLRLSVFQKE